MIQTTKRGLIYVCLIKSLDNLEFKTGSRLVKEVKLVKQCGQILYLLGTFSIYKIKLVKFIGGGISYL